ncbi:MULTISPECIES: hypothetical protein [unclassified Rhizobium]|uniref:hypothetical protein n=1 Tax=unclassified Rhizobium TaxID=2613769 RepID=UPI0024798CDB|nr:MULTISPECIES: hypothetical protein [unclassified Rhizobium]MDH7801663.1 hypothetical protein [Rhizobium sp. AN70]
MNQNSIVEGAISNLANSMRIFVEANLRFADIFKVDREEAIDNVDRAFEMKLETFHTLYDVSKDLFPYFDHPDTSLLIAVRNAVHHRNHPLFRTLNHRLHIQGGLQRSGGASFLLAGHPTTHGGQIAMSHCVRLDDVDSRLDPSFASPYLDTFMNSGRAEKRFELISEGLALPNIRKRAMRERYPSDQVYLDLMPVFVSSVCKVFKAMKAAKIGFIGFDAATYLEPFTSEIEVDLTGHQFKRLWLRGFGDLDLIPIPV